MKKIIIFLCFFIANLFLSQSLCETMSNINNDFLTASVKTAESKFTLSSKEGQDLQQKFERHLTQLDEIASEYSDEKSFMNFRKLKAYTGFASYLFSTGQKKELQDLSKQNENLTKEINVGVNRSVECKGSGYDDVQYFDEETETYYTARGLTTITKISKSKQDVDKLCDIIYPYFSYANYLQGDMKKGDEFFLKDFDNGYFFVGSSELMKSLAMEILTKYDDQMEIRNIDFAAAVCYIYFYDPAKAKTENERKIAAIFYEVSMAILKKDNQFSSRFTKGEKLALSNPNARSEAYQFVVYSLVLNSASNKKDAVDLMKKLFLAQKETKRYVVKTYDFAQLFYKDRINNDNLTNAVLDDNDPVFMTQLSDLLLNHFREYDSYTASDTIYQIYLFYKKAGQNGKAKKAFKTIHEKVRGNYKEL